MIILIHLPFFLEDLIGLLNLLLSWLILFSLFLPLIIKHRLLLPLFLIVSQFLLLLFFCTYVAEHLASLTIVLNTTEPANHKQASQDPRWIAAMEKEILALEQNETWDLVPLPADKRAIGCQWVFTTKFHPDG